MGREGRDPRARRSWVIAGLGTAIVGPAFAALSAVAGGGGRSGLAFFLLGALLATAAGALYAVATGALDSLRDRPVGRERVIAAAVLGVLTLLLPAMILGLTA